MATQPVPAEREIAGVQASAEAVEHFSALDNEHRELMGTLIERIREIADPYGSALSIDWYVDPEESSWQEFLIEATVGAERWSDLERQLAADVDRFVGELDPDQRGWIDDNLQVGVQPVPPPA